jgi:outer membrane protein assembly factor BamB
MVFLRSSVLLLIFGATTHAADWPQWLGPQRDGSSVEKVAAWSEPLKVLWRQPVGEGHSSPVVAGGKVYLHTRVKDNDEQLAAFDAVSGKPAWQTAYSRAAFKSLFGNGPRATPAVDNGKVYTFGITGVLTCFDTANGRQLWQKDTLKEFNAKNLFFGASCSPLVDGNHVLINVGGPGASIVAFDKNTGDVVWKTLDDRATYSSPALIGADGQRTIVFLTQKGLVGLAPKDGGLRWQFPLVDKLSESSTTPILAGDILMGSSITYGSVGLKIDTAGRKQQATQVWMNPDLTCYFSTPVPVGKDHIYVVTGTKPPALSIQATLRCIEAKSGKELWNRPKVGKYHASLLRTGDNKLLMLEENGDLVLLDPSPQEYRELARSKICGTTWAHAALANGRLFIRDGKELLCVQIAK